MMHMGWKPAGVAWREDAAVATPSNPSGHRKEALRDSYDLFTRLRALGIRAHSWV